MPTWPVSPFPQRPLKDGYSEQPGFPVIQAPVEGPALSRRRYTASPKFLSLKFEVTTSQLTAFDTFYKTDLKHGSLPYTWKERGDPANPDGNFRIVETPVYTNLGGDYWHIEFRAIQLP